MQNLSSNCWAPIGDAIKLILTGATDETLSSEQTAIYLDIFDQGMRDIEGNKSKERYLPGVQTEQYCVDEKNGKYETMYFIPDLFRFMLTMFKDWSILNPPVNLDYLNSIGFMYSDAPGQKQWEESAEGKEHWNQVCRKIEIEQEIDELERTHHGNDPLKLEAQKRMRKELDVELLEVKKKLKSYDTIERIDINDDKSSTIVQSQNDWKLKARDIGEKFCKQSPHLSVEQIADKVYEEMKEKNITGRGDRTPLASTIKRQALTGIKSEK